MRFSMVQWKEHRFGLLHDKDICLTDTYLLGDIWQGTCPLEAKKIKKYNNSNIHGWGDAFGLCL